MIQEQLKNFAAARDAYENLLSVAPNSPLALNNLAVLYSEHLGQLDKAYDLAQKAKEAVPNEPHIADTLGWILFKKGDYGNALRLLQESAGKLPDLPEVQFHVGDGALHVRRRRACPSCAAEGGRRSLRIFRVRMKRASDLPYSRSRLERQMLVFGRNWKITCGNGRMIPQHWCDLQQVQERDGAVDQAVKTYEKVVADNPLYAPATRQLALLYGQLSTDSPKAYELVTKARQAYPDDPDIAKTLGILNYRRGYYPQSVELLKEAAAKRKDDPELLYYLGEAYHQLKQYDRMQGCAAACLNLEPFTRTCGRRKARTRGLL